MYNIYRGTILKTLKIVLKTVSQPFLISPISSVNTMFENIIVQDLKI